MTDDPTPTAEETVEPSTEEGAASPDATEETQDVGALKRALDREREERRQAKEELRRLREDEDARRELLAQWGYEIADDSDDEDDFDDEDDGQAQPLHDPRVDELLAERAQERYERDLSRFADGRELSDVGREWIATRTFNSGNNPEALEKAVKAWVEYEDGLRASGQQAYKESKKAPHVAPGGKPSSGPQHDLRTSEGRSAYFKERLGQQA